MTSLIQLRPCDISRITKELSLEQCYKCAICKCSIAHGRIALDHNHRTGRVRAVLCNQCNRSEGKVRIAVMFMSKANHMVKRDPLGWLLALVSFIDHHNKHPSVYIHPSWDHVKKKHKPVKRRKKVVRK